MHYVVRGKNTSRVFNGTGSFVRENIWTFLLTYIILKGKAAVFERHLPPLFIMQSKMVTITSLN